LASFYSSLGLKVSLLFFSFTELDGVGQVDGVASVKLEVVQ
jgi:hypothetical protein